MVFPVPTTLSPSRVDAFTTCPLQFRFTSIEKLAEPPSPHAVKGTLVHRALERLLCLAPAERTLDAGLTCLDASLDELRASVEWAALRLDADGEGALVDDAERLVRRYFTIEDPATVRAIGLELRLAATVGDLTLQGIIDRLELDPDGELVVTDYKTGRPPRHQHEQSRLGGVQFYAFLCEQALGRRPARIQLLYLSTGEVIENRPSERSTAFLSKRTLAVHQAIERACHQGDFRPRPGALCDYCSFRSWCSAFGGDPDRAAAEAPAALGLVAA